ncbi:hypothetical protein CN514_04990 [Bacillus sp. AFS001701]|uniref:DUF4288 domain-containing protein n=1 Tax=Bacillus sp. AFS001701 TaxID=2033480 RepID=UPI000BF9E120|nr:DUF4288 domain-containing protein [Bacillus sp. AFS001701]PET74951.1 hypothetical protein CN514_04990 [Bacillus sp. AFS001701]
MNKRMRKKKLDWYTVTLLFEYQSVGEPDLEKIDEEYTEDKLYEEITILFQASSHEQAHAKAKRVAKDEEREFTNVYGETVKYVFIKAIQSLHLWDKTLQTGTEVHYRFLYTPNKLSREDFLSQQYP